MENKSNMRKVLDSSWQAILQQVESLHSTYASAQGANIALFGAGAAGQEALQYFQNKGISIQCFIDNDPQKQGIEVGGIPVVSVKHPLVTSSAFVLITAKTAVNVIRKQLQDLHFRCIPFDAYYVIDNIACYTWVRNEALADDHSRLNLDGILMSMLTGSLKYCTAIMDSNQYFCLPHFQDIGEEYFVDAGAYVGDTIERFIWENTGLFHHIYMFEPGVQQLTALKNRMNRLITEWAIDPSKISIINAGLSDQNSNAFFGTTSTKLAATAIDHNAKLNPNDRSCIPLWSLDSYLEQYPSPVTFIKADVEGMEMSMLKGAANTIRRYKPKLALSVYHKPGDLFAIIDFVRSHVPEYQLSLRHHSSNLSETVLYCWTDADCIDTGERKSPR
jgi:FkbM family methyltransferase